MVRIVKPSEHVSEQAALAAELVGHAVVPIFRSDDRASPDFEGSGVLLRIGEEHFLASAAHVFDQCDDHIFLLADGAERSALAERPIKTHVAVNERRSDDKIDLGFVRLTRDESERLGSKNFLAPADLNPLDAQARRGQYFAFGFPGKLQERDDKDTIYRTSAAYYVTVEGQRRGYRFCGIKRDSHLLLAYSKKALVSRHGGPVPDFKGMSGGGVWRFNALQQQTADNRAKLVALTIERPHCFGPSILCTRVELLLAGIRAFFPKLASLIPPSPTLRVNVRFARRDRPPAV